MGSNPQFLDIIILFVIAVLLISRLRSVLGTRSDEESPEEKDNDLNTNKSSIFDDNDHKIIDIKEHIIEKTTETNPVIAKIKEKDVAFDEKEFIEGAKVAFEMILKAYADNDIKTLKNLLAQDVLNKFITAIEKRKENNQTMECQLIGFNKTEIVSSDLIGSEAIVIVRFESEQVNIIKDNEENVISGDPNYIEDITDIWTFTRNINSNDPNWKLTSTRSV